MSDAEKRTWPRFRVKPGSYAAYPEGAAALRDLSLGGAFIEDNDPLPEGSEVFCDINVGNQSVSVKGIVRRSIPQVGMGIEFKGMSSDAQSRLRISLRDAARL